MIEHLRVHSTYVLHKQIGTRQNEGNSKEETETFFDRQKNKAQQRKQSVTFNKYHQLIKKCSEVQRRERREREREREGKEDSALAN